MTNAQKLFVSALLALSEKPGAILDLFEATKVRVYMKLYNLWLCCISVTLLPTFASVERGDLNGLNPKNRALFGNNTQKFVPVQTNLSTKPLFWANAPHLDTSARRTHFHTCYCYRKNKGRAIRALAPKRFETIFNVLFLSHISCCPRGHAYIAAMHLRVNHEASL